MFHFFPLFNRYNRLARECFPFIMHSRLQWVASLKCLTLNSVFYGYLFVGNAIKLTSYAWKHVCLLFKDKYFPCFCIFASSYYFDLHAVFMLTVWLTKNLIQEFCLGSAIWITRILKFSLRITSIKVLYFNLILV